jgi:hypothetical protein
MAWRVLGKGIDPARHPPFDETSVDIENLTYLSQQGFDEGIIVKS